MTNAAYGIFDSLLVSPGRDPGASGTITTDRSPHVVALVSAAAESRTLARPTRAGAVCFLFMKTDGGDITLTVTGGYNEDGETSFTFSDPGQFAEFRSVYDGTNYIWRKTADHALGNLSAAALAILDGFDGLLATVAELNRAADVSTRVVTHGPSDANSLALTEALHDGKTLYVTKTDGLAITLPVPVPGMRFRIVIGATIASASTIKSVAGTHLMIGHARLGNDSTNATVDWQALAANTFDTIDLLGTGNSTGGIEGQVITIEAMTTTRWFVEIAGDAAGTEATPFSDTVT